MNLKRVFRLNPHGYDLRKKSLEQKVKMTIFRLALCLAFFVFAGFKWKNEEGS